MLHWGRSVRNVIKMSSIETKGEREKGRYRRIYVNICLIILYIKNNRRKMLQSGRVSDNVKAHNFLLKNTTLKNEQLIKNCG